MRDVFEKKWVAILLASILLCLVMVIWSALSPSHASPVSNLVNILMTPIQDGVSWVTNGAKSVVEHYTKYEELEAENQELRKELADMRGALRDADQAVLENEQLRAALGMKTKNSSYEMESAEIIARSNDTWSRSFTIDKGTLSGVQIDNCVVTVDGLVGYVSEVGTNWAMVTSIVDPSSQLSAIASRTREVATAEGSFELMGQNVLKLTYLDKETKIVQGDTVETSGYGGIFPKGLIIGSVGEVKLETHGASKYAIITPAVDLKKITRVLVIKSFEITE
ncbi:MAG: rod shape-determining protein MreC [Oscillospiraceae bacterium]|nr:rod shape-determining protein MreC [Oscillospiraceae bacterium]